MDDGYTTSEGNYAQGANYSQVNKIRAYAAEGYSAEEISRALSIVLPCVESYMGIEPAREVDGTFKPDDPDTADVDEAHEVDGKPVKRKRRTKAEMEADAAEEAAKESEE